MNPNLQLVLIRKLLRKEEEGFSLIELVVVVAVLAVLSAIALPSFNCFPKRAKATAALAALRQINTECVYKENDGVEEVFTNSPLDSYTIQSGGSNSCDGVNGVISAVPADANELPTFNLTSATGSLTYAFRGKTGTNFQECLRLICGDSVEEDLTEKDCGRWGMDELGNCYTCTSVGPECGGTWDENYREEEPPRRGTRDWFRWIRERR